MAAREPTPPRPPGFRDIAEMFASYSRKTVPQPQPRSYASVTADPPIPHSSAIVSDDGDFKMVRINQSAFEKRVQLCAHSLIGRLSLNKGELPWKLDNLKTVLTKIWGLTISWRLISLGKGFYHLLLPSEDIKYLIRSKGVLSLKPGIFRVQPWSTDFDPNTQKATNAQVWIRLYNLPWVYWDPIILSDIASGIGGLVRFDRSTIEGDYGHYARILLDIDMASKLQNSIGIERDGKKFWIQIVYEDLPKYCKVCSNIGHMAYNCKQQNPTDNGASGMKVNCIISKYKRSLEDKKRKVEILSRDREMDGDNRIKQRTKEQVCKQVKDRRFENQPSRTPNSPGHHKTAPAPTKAWKPAEQKENSIPVTRILKRINDELQQNFPQRVRDHESGKFVEVEDVISSSDWSSSDDDFEVNNGHLPMVNWHASTSYQQISQPISVVFPDSPTHPYTQNHFELLSSLKENEDDTVRITEITSNDGVSPKRITWAHEVEETSVIDKAKSSKKVTAWADLFGSDTEPEKIDTEIIDHSWRSNRNIQFADHIRDANSDPEGWYTVKKKYSSMPQMEPQEQVPSKQSRNYFPVGTRKSKRRVQLPKKYQPS